MKKKIKRERERTASTLLRKGKKLENMVMKWKTFSKDRLGQVRQAQESKNSSTFLQKYKLSKSFLLHSFPSMTLLYSCCPRAVKNFFLFSLAEWLYKYCHHYITYSYQNHPSSYGSLPSFYICFPSYNMDLLHSNYLSFMTAS